PVDRLAQHLVDERTAVADAGDPDRCAAPNVHILDFGGGYVKPVPDSLEHALQNGALLFQRVRLRNVQLEGAEADRRRHALLCRLSDTEEALRRRVANPSGAALLLWRL